jgi:ABC-2 type transport system permease protein
MTANVHPAMAPLAATNKRPVFGQFLWCIRREVWESRSIYIAPLIVAVLIVISFLRTLPQLNANVHALAADATSAHDPILQPYDSAALVLMGTTFIVALFYSADALYGERRDRSILFWKSTPVSDLITVLAKMSIPLLLLPLLTIAAVVVVHGAMLLMSAGVLASTGGGTSLWWDHVPVLMMWKELSIHMLAGHGLWYAPIYAWLLLVSAWAKRVPLLWAALPLAGVAIAEKIAFNSIHFLHWMGYRITGGADPSTPPPPGHMLEESIARHYLTSSGLWVGFLLAILFLVAAVQLRRRSMSI